MHGMLLNGKASRTTKGVRFAYEVHQGHKTHAVNGGHELLYTDRTFFIVHVAVLCY